MGKQKNNPYERLTDEIQKRKFWSHVGSGPLHKWEYPDALRDSILLGVTCAYEYLIYAGGWSTDRVASIKILTGTHGNLLGYVVRDHTDKLVSHDSNPTVKDVLRVMDALEVPLPDPVPTPPVVRSFKAHLFGHYDSRGGAVLIVAPTTELALKEYARGFGYMEVDSQIFPMVGDDRFTPKDAPDPAENQRLLQSLKDKDYMGHVLVTVYGRDIPGNSSELLFGYTGEDGYREAFDGVAQHLILAWDDGMPVESNSIWFQLHGFNFGDADISYELGEDAFGLILVEFK